MALMSCPECAKQISDKAPACPHCGAPMNAPIAASTAGGPTIVETGPGGVVTTEATGKTYKALQAIGVILILIGVVSCAAGGDGVAAAPGLFLIGVVLYLFGRVGAWWKHG